VVRKRKSQQWDEYDPSPIASAPIASAPKADGADDAAFEPVAENTPVEPVNTKKD
jgi:hypothetical protein